MLQRASTSDVPSASARDYFEAYARAALTANTDENRAHWSVQHTTISLWYQRNLRHGGFTSTVRLQNDRK